MRFFIVLAALSAFIVACSKKEISKPFVVAGSNDPNGFTITGAGFSSSFITNHLDSGYYYTLQKRTVCMASCDSDSATASVRISFGGYALTSSFIAMPDTDTVHITIQRKGAQVQNYQSVPGVTAFFISVYNSYKGHIGGSFSGKFVNTLNTSDTAEVTNGRFLVTRMPDR